MVLKDYIKRGKTPIKESYYKRLAEVEASNNPNAQAKTSSAAGLYQFTKGTWNGLTKQMGLDYSEDDRFDPVKSRQVVEEFTRKNKNYLMRKLGREPNEAELYLAHFQGMGGANKILSSMQNDPHASVDSIVHQNVINANKNVFLNKDGSTKEVKDIYNWAAEKFGLQGYKEEAVEDIKPSFEMETREPVVTESTAVRQPIFEPIQPAKFNELFRFDNTPTELPEYDTTQQEEEKQKIPTYEEQQHIKYDPSLYEYIQLGEFQDGGEYDEGIEKPKKLKNQTEGQYKAVLRKYEKELLKWNLENNPEQLENETDENYKDRTAYFEHKRKKGRSSLDALWEDKVKTPQKELPYLPNLVSEIFTSPIDIAYYLANKIDIGDSEKNKSKKIKRSDGIEFIDSLTDASALVVPWKLPILGLSTIKNAGKALIKESGKRLIKEARQEMGFDFLQYVNENLKTPTYEEQQPIKYSPSLYESIQLGEFQDGGEYKVKSGDSLSKIAKSNNMSLEDILNLNESYREKPNIVNIGDTINLETQQPIEPQELTTFRPDFMDYTEENMQFLPEVVVTYNKVQSDRLDRLSKATKLETDLADNSFKTGINITKDKSKVLELQKFLVEEGYDLNPNNKFTNNGLDGKIGKVTRQAIDDYNSKIGQDSPYESVKEGYGKLGECTEKQCSEYVQNEIFRNAAKGSVSREEWNKEMGITGDAWTIGKNIVNKGGSEVGLSNVKEGDVITLHVDGSDYQAEADKAGTGTTHTAVVDKINNDGSFYILHNVHGVRDNKNGKEEYYGREYRTKIDAETGKDSYFKSFTAKNAFRPKYLGEKVDKVKAKEGIKVVSNTPDVKIDTRFTDIAKDTEFKQSFMNKEGIGEEEYYSLIKSALGIMGQETKFADDITYKTGAKRAGANLSKVLHGIGFEKHVLGEAILGLTDKSEFKTDEVSLGPGSMKLDTNFNSADIGLYGINKDNITEPDKAMKATMVKLTRDYKRMLKKGHNEKDSLYRAIQIYNGGLSTPSAGKTREEWAKSYDLDYVNKVLNFGSNFDVVANDSHFLTTFDELATKDNVVKWDNYVKKELQQ